jgi:hypothetical protein
METETSIVAPSFSQGQEASFEANDFGMENFPEDEDFPMDDGYDDAEVSDNPGKDLQAGGDTGQPTANTNQKSVSKPSVDASYTHAIQKGATGDDFQKGDVGHDDEYNMNDYPMDNNYDESVDQNDPNYTDENYGGQAYKAEGYNEAYGYKGNQGYSEGQVYGKGYQGQGYSDGQGYSEGQDYSEGQEYNDEQGYEEGQGYEGQGYEGQGYFEGDPSQGYEGDGSYAKEGKAGPSEGAEGYYPPEGEYYDQYDQQESNEVQGIHLFLHLKKEIITFFHFSIFSYIHV